MISASKFRRLPLMALTVGLAACATEPPGPVLEGRFGNQHVGLTASQDRAEFRFPCSMATTGPLVLQGTHVSATGTIFYSHSWSPGPTPFRATGELHGDTLSILTADQPPPVGPHVLFRDSVPDFSDVACIAGS